MEENIDSFFGSAFSKSGFIRLFYEFIFIKLHYYENNFNNWRAWIYWFSYNY